MGWTRARKAGRTPGARERAGKTIKQPHDQEQPLAHGAYLGGDGAAEEAISSHGYDVREAEGGAHKAIIFDFV